MPRAKPIDRLALTREKFGAKMYGDRVTASKSKRLENAPAEHVNVLAGYEPEPEPQPQHKEGYSICPNCGQETLIHEDGCMHCRSCGWSACG